MSKMSYEIKPNYAPAYAALYPKLAEIFQANGYALAVHGSMGRDFDLVAIPWTGEVSDPAAIVDIITTRFALWKIGEPTSKPHGRICYTLVIGHGECALDLSFMPIGKERWFSGRVMCVKCSHRWVCVALVTGDEQPKGLECPACHEMAGHPTKE